MRYTSHASFVSGKNSEVLFQSIQGRMYIILILVEIPFLQRDKSEDSVYNSWKYILQMCLMKIKFPNWMWESDVNRVPTHNNQSNVFIKHLINFKKNTLKLIDLSMLAASSDRAQTPQAF